MLQVVDLSVSVPGRRLVEGVSFEVGAGEVKALMGPSGSGKTSLLSCLSGLRLPDSGLIRIGGVEFSDLSANKRSLFRLSNIGVVFQTDELLAELTAVENVALPERLRGRPRQAAIDAGLVILDQLGLAHLADSYPEQLSGGERQRVGVARAFVTRPALVIADEPTGMLDPASTSAVVDLMTSACARLGAAGVVATHDREVAARLDRTLHIHLGRVVEEALAP